MSRGWSDDGFLRELAEKVDKTAPGGCWEWLGCRDKEGYGVRGRRVGMPTRRVHRLSWELHNDRPAGDLHVLHHCDNPPCVNPAHLFVGTNQDNIMDRVRKERSPRGQDIYAAKLDPGKVESIREEYAGGGVTQDDLAEKYNVQRTTISLVLRGEVWAWTGGPRSRSARRPPFTAEEVRAIRAEYNAGSSQSELVLKYNIGNDSISRLLRGVSYGWVV